MKNNPVFDLIGVFSAPVITHTKAWADVIPERLLNIIPISRMIGMMKHEELATYAETCAYMYTATHEAPMSHEWSEIYVHVSCTVTKEFWNEYHFETIGAPRELNEYLTGKLTRLRSWLYKKRLDHVKSIARQSKKDEKASEQIVEQQLTLF